MCLQNFASQVSQGCDKKGGESHFFSGEEPGIRSLVCLMRSFASIQAWTGFQHTHLPGASHVTGCWQMKDHEHAQP